MFGENFTVEGGLFEDQIFVGDSFRVGTAEILAVQPRMPCYKLGVRFGTQRIVQQFARARRYGVYFRVLKEGLVAVGDSVTKIGESDTRISIRDVGRLLLEEPDDLALVARAATAEFLPVAMRERFQRLAEESK